MSDNEEIDPLGWRLSESIVRGEIDNRTPGRTNGRLWIIDREFPVELVLKGNPLRDMAGCLLRFENPNPMPEDNEGLCPVQMGRTGMMTASLKLRVIDIPVETEKTNRVSPKRKTVGNALKLEWFSNANGRVVVESSDFNIQISGFSWRMTKEEEQEQLQRNAATMERWRDIVAEDLDETDEDWEDFDPHGHNWHLNEFEWERQFQESDALTKRYMQLMESYINHPDRDKIIAHEMGWNWYEEVEELIDEEWEDSIDEEMEALPKLDPNPLTEGRDWIRTPDGRIRHPLSFRTAEAVRGIWRSFRQRGHLEENQDSDLHNLLFHSQTFNAKLAAAIDSLAYDDEPDGGFIVACLKRTLKGFDQVMTYLNLVSQKNLVSVDELQAFRDEMFAIRQEMINLMHYYRQNHG